MSASLDRSDSHDAIDQKLAKHHAFAGEVPVPAPEREASAPEPQRTLDMAELYAKLEAHEAFSGTEVRIPRTPQGVIDAAELFLQENDDLHAPIHDFAKKDLEVRALLASVDTMVMRLDARRGKVDGQDEAVRSSQLMRLQQIRGVLAEEARGLETIFALQKEGRS